jgi:GH25 family lysozyme M1 (1,4-beta-N-acetylmuramidase)
MNKVIDISTHQKEVDWSKVAKTDVKGVILKIGFRAYITGKLVEDNMFESHLKGAKKTKLKIGVYFFSQAISEEEAREEARYTVKLLKAFKLKPFFPIAFDTEHVSDPKARANGLPRSHRTQITKAFCEEIKKLGYKPMIYASTSWLNDNLDMSKLPYKVWVADYRDKNYYKGEYAMWQFTDKGKVDGIPEGVDASYDYEFIKEKKKMATVKWSGNLTKHFSLSEYAVENGNTTITINERAYKFAQCLEEFRVWLERPMIVTSWRRSVALNKQVGGISTSNHLTGTAADWHTNIPVNKEKFVKYARKWKRICKKHGFVGEAGLYYDKDGNPWFVHFGIQNEAQAKANGYKFINWFTQNGKQKNWAFKI